MKFNPRPLLQVLLLSFIIIFQFSCSKDSDLLSDYVISDSLEQVLIDDTFVVSLNGSTVLDVLANDSLGEENSVVITEVTQPNNGNTTINEDNTITYTPETDEETEDTFTYTTEVVDENETVSTQTGNVTVTVSENYNQIAGKNINWSQVMFTDDQITLMIERLKNGFSRPGTNGEDITEMVSEAADFLANPTVLRLDWMPSSGLSTCGNGCSPVPANAFDGSHEISDNISYAAYYAFILANRNNSGDLAYAEQLANAVASQILARTNEPGLDFTDTSNYLREVHTEPYFMIIAWLEKMMNNWSLIKSMNLVTNLTTTEEKAIDNWFKDGRDWLMGRLQKYYSDAFGTNWKTSPISTGYNKVWFKPLYAVNNVEVTGTTPNFAAYVPHANMPAKDASFLHHYGLIYHDQEALDLVKTWWHNFFKLAVFPDGTSVEMNRASGSDPKMGLHYWSITMAMMTGIAHGHAVAVLNNNPVVSGESYSYYYDYTTSLGLSDYLKSHAASDTKGGVKGLENWLLAFTKYLGQSTGLNAWGEIRQVNESPYPTHEMTIYYPYFVPMAQANAYYNNTELKSCYSGTNGYHVPKTRNEGATMISAWSESYQGGFGKTLVAFPYLETEGLFD